MCLRIDRFIFPFSSTGILPDRVGRVVIDGVLNPVLWAGASQAKVLHNVFQDTDKVFEGFVEFCVKVCSFGAL